jgi:probable phosphoglycerate mutase
MLYFDGGIRKGRRIACAYVAFEPPSNFILFGNASLCGEGTSNEAEYLGLLAALEACVSHGVKKVRIHSDSQLVVKHVNGAYQAKKPELMKMLKMAQALLDKFEDWSLKWIPRKENKVADALVQQVLDGVEEDA